MQLRSHEDSWSVWIGCLVIAFSIYCHKRHRLHWQLILLQLYPPPPPPPGPVAISETGASGMPALNSYSSADCTRQFLLQCSTSSSPSAAFWDDWKVNEKEHQFLPFPSPSYSSAHQPMLSQGKKIREDMIVITALKDICFSLAERRWKKINLEPIE